MVKLSLISSFLFIACGASWQVYSVIKLPPPEEVKARVHDERITVEWRAGAESEVEEFSGYYLYMAHRSLSTVPLEEMPQPIAVPPGVTEYSFAMTDSLPLFIHVRSRIGRRKLSLPSLPELVGEPETVVESQQQKN